MTHDGVKFERVSEVEVKVAITTTLDAAVFPADGITTIKTNLAAYAAAEWEIGEDIVAVRLYSPANAVFGHSISALAVTDTSDNALPVRLLP